jgi:4-amino-4-deoxy-L-arabinose transferase-like glycosyltransferase
MFHKVTGASYEINKFKDDYDLIAINVIKGNGYRYYPETADTLTRPPLYVLLLCSVFYLFGKSLLAVQVVNILLGIATVLVVRSLCLQLKLSNTTTLIAMTLAFFHPAVVLAESRGGIESIFTLSLTSFVLLLYKALENNSRTYYVFRDTPRRCWNNVINVAVLTAITLVVISPWIIRNYRLTGSLVPTMTVSGTVAQEGLYVNKNFGTSRERYQLAEDAAMQRNELATQLGFSFRPGFLTYFYESKDEINFDRYLFAKTIQEYKEDPILFVQSVFMNFVRFWFQGRMWSATRMNVALTLPFLLLALIGIYLSLFSRFEAERATVKPFQEASSKQCPVSNLIWSEKQSGKYLTPLLLFIGYFVLVHLPFQGLARYHVPIIPCMAILAAIPLSAALYYAPLYWRLKEVFRTSMVQT